MSQDLNNTTGPRGVSFIQCILLFVLFCSCTVSQDPSFFPLEPGYEWRYRVQHRSSGEVVEQRLLLTSIDSREIENQQYFVQRSLTGAQILFQQSSAGIERAGFIKSSGVDEVFIREIVLILPATLEIGYEWESVVKTRALLKKWSPGKAVPSNVSAKVPVVNRIEALDAEVKTTAGRFNNCLMTSTTGFAFHSGDRYSERVLVEIKQTDWYAPGIGLVKSVLSESSSSDAFANAEITVELDSYLTP